MTFISYTGCACRRCPRATKGALCLTSNSGVFISCLLLFLCALIILTSVTTAQVDDGSVAAASSAFEATDRKTHLPPIATTSEYPAAEAEDLHISNRFAVGDLADDGSFSASAPTHNGIDEKESENTAEDAAEPHFSNSSKYTKWSSETHRNEMSKGLVEGDSATTAVDNDDETLLFNNGLLESALPVVSAGPPIVAAGVNDRTGDVVQTTAPPTEVSNPASGNFVGAEAEALCNGTALPVVTFPESGDDTYVSEAGIEAVRTLSEEMQGREDYEEDSYISSELHHHHKGAILQAPEGNRTEDSNKFVRDKTDNEPLAWVSETPTNIPSMVDEAAEGKETLLGATPTTTGEDYEEVHEVARENGGETQQHNANGAVLETGDIAGNDSVEDDVAETPSLHVESKAKGLGIPATKRLIDEEIDVPVEDTGFSDDHPTPALLPQTAQPMTPEIFSSADTGFSNDAVAAVSETQPHYDANGEHRETFATEPEWIDAASFPSPETVLYESLGVDSDDVEVIDNEMSTLTQEGYPTTPFTSGKHTSKVAPPSRLALSYLYYRALEALYVKENVTLFVQRARDTVPYGHARLNWQLGVLHAYGVGVPRSERDALLYYSFAAMEGVPEAHMALGYRYRNGLGVRASCEAALAHYREAADAVAMTYDGSAADLDGRSETELTGARTILSNGGSHGGHGLLSFFTYRDNAANSDMASRAQRDLLTLIYQADRGSGQALLALGYVYLKGNRQVRRDGRKAETYLKQAAAKGIAEAHGALGNLYIAGDTSVNPPLPRDLARAYHHYRLGTLQKDAISLNGIGFLHAIGYLENDAPRAPSGEGSINVTTTAPAFDFVAHPPDFATAVRYFESSRSAESIYNLAVLHLYGRGVPQDRAAAQRLFWNAAQGGSVLARWQLAHLIDESVEQNPGECVKAVELYSETASYGSWYRGDAGGSIATGPLASTPQSTSDDIKNDGNQGHGDSDEEDYEYNDEGDAHGTAFGEMHRLSEGRGSHEDGAATGVNGPSALPTKADYERQLHRILRRLQSVEESLRLSDSEEGPVLISIASFVELLSLAETGDAASTWLAVQFAENYLAVEGETRGGKTKKEPTEGHVDLLWPSSAGTAAFPAAATPTSSLFLSPEAAHSELLYYLLRRTVLHPRHKNSAHGAAYLRLGDLFFYGEVPQHEVDMARAMAYYRLAADVCHNPQALFNVGFMYQLGLHKAPRATLVSSANFADELPEQLGARWKVHSNPPLYLTGAPSSFLVAQAAAHAWNRDSTNAMSRAVDVYLAWQYYTESLRREVRGWMAVQFALLTLNVQWSLRHFGLLGIFAPATSLSGFTYGRGRGSLLSPPHSSTVDGSNAAVAGFRHHQQQQEQWQDIATDTDADAVRVLVDSFTTVMRAEASIVYRVLEKMATSLAALYGQAEQVILRGAIGVFVLALLVRHHAL